MSDRALPASPEDAAPRLGFERTIETTVEMKLYPARVSGALLHPCELGWLFQDNSCLHVDYTMIPGSAMVLR